MDRLALAAATATATYAVEIPVLAHQRRNHFVRFPLGFTIARLLLREVQRFELSQSGRQFGRFLDCRDYLDVEVVYDGGYRVQLICPSTPNRPVNQTKAFDKSPEAKPARCRSAPQRPR